MPSRLADILFQCRKLLRALRVGSFLAAIALKSGASATNTLSPKDSINTGIGLMRSYPWIESIANSILSTLAVLSILVALGVTGLGAIAVLPGAKQVGAGGDGRGRPRDGQNTGRARAQ